MTMIIPSTVKCAVCGTEHHTLNIMSTSSFGPSDLDLRPSQPARSTLDLQMQYCHVCGYAHYDLGEKSTPDIDKIVRSEEYRALRESTPARVAKFVLSAYVYEKEKAYPRAAFTYVKGAWTCDDGGDKEYAKKLRLKAVECFLRSPEELESNDNHMVVVDLLRRAGEFQRAIEHLERMPLSESENEVLSAVGKFECELCLRKDADRYTTEDAERFAKGN